MTPALSCAVEGGHREVVKLLLSKGAKVSNLHMYNNTILYRKLKV